MFSLHFNIETFKITNRYAYDKKELRVKNLPDRINRKRMLKMDNTGESKKCKLKFLTCAT